MPDAALVDEIRLVLATRLSLGRTEPEPDDLTPAIGGGDRDSDYRGNRDDAAAIADLQVGSEPQIRPFTVNRSVERR
jgi:hypothetical protein